MPCNDVRTLSDYGSNVAAYFKKRNDVCAICSPTFDLSIYDSMWISIGHSKQDIEFELLNKEINQ